jgi:sulfatase modifying factor 1
MAITINIPDTLRKSVEAASGGKNTVLYTAKGQPCFMHILQHTDMATVNSNLGIARHPAHIVNSVNKSEVFIGMYPGFSSNGEMVSQPGLNPINTITFDSSVSLARANGSGWHVMSNAEWSAVALYCYYAGFQPRGNTDYGRSSDLTSERGVDDATGRLALATGTATTRTRGGSGPVSWRHDNTPFGIADLTGNTWEWQTGLRVNNGEINIIPNNDSALITTDFGASSAAWKAIDGSNGSLVAPGSANTVKYASANSGTAAYTLYRSSGSSFEGMVNSTGAADSPPTPVSAAALTVLRSYGAFPVASSGLGADGFFLNVSGERVAIRGGTWGDGALAGVFFLILDVGRSTSTTGLGARPAFVL